MLTSSSIAQKILQGPLEYGAPHSRFFLQVLHAKQVRCQQEELKLVGCQRSRLHRQAQTIGIIAACILQACHEREPDSSLANE